jgi:hypothetical protein
MTISALRTGITGVQSGIQKMTETAGKIVDTTTGNGKKAGTTDLATEIVNLNLYETQVKASVKVVKSADQNIGTLLDVTS